LPELIRSAEDYRTGSVLDHRSASSSRGGRVELFVDGIGEEFRRAWARS
jgi:hypothetical protein